MSESTGYKQSIEDALPISDTYTNCKELHHDGVLSKELPRAGEEIATDTESRKDGHRVKDRSIAATAKRRRNWPNEQPSRPNDRTIRNILWQARCAVGKAYRA